MIPGFRILILLGLICSLGVRNAAAGAEAQPRTRPNIVFMFIDDMGYGDLSCFGNTKVQTPHIDRLAEQGIRLTQFYVASPICSPSRVAVTTGRFPARHLINSYLNRRSRNRERGMVDFLDPNVPAIARSFHQAGYATAHFGKWHMGGGRDVDDAPLPAAYGFDESLVSFEGLGDRILPPGGLSKQSAELERGDIRWVEKHQQTEIYVDRSIDFIERNRNRPFYLHLWLNDVHDAHRPAPGSAETFANVTSNPRERDFFAVLTEMDRQLGRLVDRIDELGLASQTLIVLTSDNGPTAWPHYARDGFDAPGSTGGYRGRKWSLYEGGIRMPFIARWSGKIPEGAVDSQSIVSSVDLYPTFCALADIPLDETLREQDLPNKPYELDGEDVSRALLGQTAHTRSEPLFWEYGRDASYLQPSHPIDRSPNIAVRDGRWKLLVNADGSRTELYEFSDDGEVNEYRNVAGHHPDVAERLKQAALDWRRGLPALEGQETPQAKAVEGGIAHTYGPGAVVSRAKSPSIASSAVQIAARVTPNGADGVIVAQGGSAAGYALYVQEGRLTFSTRVRKVLTTVTGPQLESGQAVMLDAVLERNGTMSLSVDGEVVASGKAPGTVPNQPGDGLEVGRDRISPVGTYAAPFPWSGAIEKVTVTVEDKAAAPLQGTLVTRFAGDVDPENPLPEYPRPTLRREAWHNLNGYWQYAIVPRDKPQPEKWDGRILVPFCPESILSGVQRRVGVENALWYRRTFDIPEELNLSTVQLNFGAVDWETTVWVNGSQVVQTPHRGGHDSFGYRIGHLLKADGPNELIVRVWDPTDEGSQPRGKQVASPRGIWYTPVTGIWQTVWLESPQWPSISKLHITPDIDAGRVQVEVTGGLEYKDPPDLPVVVRALADGKVVSSSRIVLKGGFGTATLSIPDPRLWSPEDPFLYDLEVAVDREQGDRVSSYFGMRKIHFGPDEAGINRLFLNNKPRFQYGLLDQGWWPDGLYTAPTDEALRYDIDVTKRLGFNLARKHVKVEPERWYMWCDRMGLLVWQDMPSGMRKGDAQFVKRNETREGEFTDEEHAQFLAELNAMLSQRHNHPSIVAWIPFNEGWGQHRTNEILRRVKDVDPSRLVGGPSGWSDRGYGDFLDIHRYPGPAMAPVQSDRVSILGEFGGLGLPIAGHTWLGENNWGYRTYTSRSELEENYRRLLTELTPLIEQGLGGAIYTQTTDVEIEVNGLMTYDRAVIKLDPETYFDAHRTLIGRE